MVPALLGGSAEVSFCCSLKATAYSLVQCICNHPLRYPMKFKTLICAPQARLLPALALLSPLLCALVILTSVGCQSIGAQNAETASAAGAELFRSKCGKCHDPELALKEYRSEKVWEDTITRMREEHRADISQAEAERLVQYHVERQKREAAIFQAKCQKCHPGKVFLQRALTPDEARAIVKRMQQKAGNTIEDKDVEIIVRYHMQAQQAALDKNLSGITESVLRDNPRMKKGMALFVKKCSACHTPNRALSVIKDPQVWAETIKRMQHYSKGAISDQEAKELVDFHVTEQQREVNTFKETCTHCHTDERINSRSMSEEQWLATIKRMQKKMPELITDDKVTLLAAYFHRRELVLARIFSGKCQLCHIESNGKATPVGSSKQMDGLIMMTQREFGESIHVTDVNELLAIHLQRQKRDMALFARKCTTCHTSGLPVRKVAGSDVPKARTRAEWISIIATMQGVELTKENQETINSQIDFHIAKQ